MALLDPSLAPGDFPPSSCCYEGLVRQALRCQAALPGHRLSWHLVGQKAGGGGAEGQGRAKVTLIELVPALPPTPCLDTGGQSPGSHGPSGRRRGVIQEGRDEPGLCPSLSPPPPPHPAQQASVAGRGVCFSCLHTDSIQSGLSPPPTPPPACGREPGHQGERSPPLPPACPSLSFQAFLVFVCWFGGTQK